MVLGLFKQRPKPKTIAEDVALCMVRCGNALRSNGPEADLRAPIQIVETCTPLKKHYEMDPASGSLVHRMFREANNSNEGLQSPEFARLLDELRGRLSRMPDAEYHIGLEMLEVYQPEFGRLVRENASSRQKTWKDLGSDIGNVAAQVAD